MVQRKPLVAGNWKMNGLAADLGEISRCCEHVSELGTSLAAEVMFCPPATLISATVEQCRSARVAVGAQDCHVAQSGAHTGDLSAHMLRDAGASAVIVGHSERRGDHGETDALVGAKAAAAHDAGLTAIVCIGETAGQRHYGLTLNVLERQISGSVPNAATGSNTIIAYEPVWAIGTGLTPTPDDVANAHAFMRERLGGLIGAAEAAQIRLLYGGSVKPANARELMQIADVDGALVGGASLKANDFCGIIDAFVTK